MSSRKTAQYGSQGLIFTGFVAAGPSTSRTSSVISHSSFVIRPGRVTNDFLRCLVYLIGAGKAARFLFLDQVEERLLGLLADAADADHGDFVVGQGHEHVGQSGGVAGVLAEAKFEAALARLDRLEVG